MKQALYHKFHLKIWFVFISFVYFNYIYNEEIDIDNDENDNNNENNSSNYIIDLSEEKDSTQSKNQKKW